MSKKRRIADEENQKVKFWKLIFNKVYENDEGDDILRINVMTRVRTDIIDTLDALVELGAFNSRSEAVSVYTEQAILSQSKLYEKLKKHAQDMSKVRDSAVDLIKDFREKER